MRRSDALEPAHLPRPSSGRLMRILGSIVAPSTTLVALRGPEIMGCGAIGPQLICDEPSGQGRGDRSAFVLQSPEPARDAAMSRRNGHRRTTACRSRKLAASSLSCGGAKRQQVQPMCFTKPVPPFIAASFVYKHAAYRSARHPPEPCWTTSWPGHADANLRGRPPQTNPWRHGLGPFGFGRF